MIDEIEKWLEERWWVKKKGPKTESLISKIGVSSLLAMWVWTHNHWTACFWAAGFCFMVLSFIEELYQQHNGSPHP